MNWVERLRDPEFNLGPADRGMIAHTLAAYAEQVEALYSDRRDVRDALRTLLVRYGEVRAEASVAAAANEHADAIHFRTYADGLFEAAQRLGGVLKESKLQLNLEPLTSVERRDNVTAVSAIRGRSRDDRLRVWLALGGSAADFDAENP